MIKFLRHEDTGQYLIWTPELAAHPKMKPSGPPPWVKDTSNVAFPELPSKKESNQIALTEDLFDKFAENLGMTKEQVLAALGEIKEAEMVTVPATPDTLKDAVIVDAVYVPPVEAPEIDTPEVESALGGAVDTVPDLQEPELPKKAALIDKEQGAALVQKWLGKGVDKVTKNDLAAYAKDKAGLDIDLNDSRNSKLKIVTLIAEAKNEA